MVQDVISFTSLSPVLLDSAPSQFLERERRGQSSKHCDCPGVGCYTSGPLSQTTWILLGIPDLHSPLMFGP